MELLSVRVTLNLHRVHVTCGITTHRASLRFIISWSLRHNPLVFTLSFFLNNFMYNSPKYKSYGVCFLVWNQIKIILMSLITLYFQKTGIFRGLGFLFCFSVSSFLPQHATIAQLHFASSTSFRLPRGWNHHTPNLDWGTHRRAQLSRTKPPCFMQLIHFLA